jgi:tetratricopeptide (TPR) repeat protein
VADNPRIEELRRRVLKDKASIAFAQLAEEYRRAGRFDEAIETCRTGLSHHPGYLSAHVTLGRALIEVGELQPAQDELGRVLAAAPENLAALKGLAEIHHRRGELAEALQHYRQALVFAPHDPDIEHLVGLITRELEPTAGKAQVPDGLSFEEAMGEFLALGDQAAPPAVPAELVQAEIVAPADDLVSPAAETPLPVAWPPPPVETEPEKPPVEVQEPLAEAEELPAAVAPLDIDDAPANPAGEEPAPADPPPPPASAGAESPSKPRATMQVEELERWLDAILAERRLRD